MRTLTWIILLVATMPIHSSISAQDADSEALPPLHTLWDYFDPAATRERLEAIRPRAEASGDSQYYLSLLTQIARTYGLQQQFDTAHAILDDVEPRLDENYPVAVVNYLLERGRTFRSSGEVAKSVDLFDQAFWLADSTGQDYLAIDAAHMMALVASSAAQRMLWSQRGLKIAEESDDPRTINWVGSINNNIGWDYHDRGEYDSALVAFQDALAARERQGAARKLQIARWSLARCLRSLGRVDEAFDIQTALLAEHRGQGTSDGYVFEELGELYLTKGDSSTAAGYFKDAYTELSKDDWLMGNEAERMARMKSLAGIE